MPASDVKEKTTTERTTEKKGHTVKVGHLGNDPELRFAPSGVAYCNFSIAVERPVVPGEWSGERTTDWYQVVCFKSLAENVAQSLGKGARVVVSGEAEVEHWTGKDDQPRVTKKIVADSVGAELRFATVEISKPERRETVPVGAGAPAGGQYEEEPF